MLSPLKHIGFAILLLILSVTSDAQGKKWAVLVGINNYSSDDITQLHYPVNDAQAVAQALQRSAGFLNENVIVMTSNISNGINMPTRHNVIKRLNALSAVIGPQDTFLFYFSGHGFQREGGNSYLATVDADSASTVDLEESTISLKALQEQIKKINARQVIFIIDACRNDPEKAKGEIANKRTVGFTKGLLEAARSAAKGRASTGVLFACSEGERAWEWDDVKQGAFTFFLLQGLKGKAVKGDELTLADLANYVQIEVRKWGQEHNKPQTPDLQMSGAAKIVLASHFVAPIIHKTQAFISQECDPIGATVLLDKQEIGKMPLTGVPVELGPDAETRTIHLTVQMDGYSPIKEDVIVTRGQSITLLPVTLKKIGGGSTTIASSKSPIVSDVKGKHSRKDGAELIFIPAGEFTMGDDMRWNTKPQHKVNLSAYYIYKNLVTVAQYKKFCQETSHAMPDPPEFDSNWVNDDCPIVNVSWIDAKSYCDWAGTKLPTEAQWEKAARGTDKRIYPWGNEWNDTKLWCSKKTTGDAKGTKPVGSFPMGASIYGVMDMAGNVSQWCSDWYNGTFYSTRSATSPDPECLEPSDAGRRVIRNGSWLGTQSNDFICTIRNGVIGSVPYAHVGFRCIIPEQP